MGILDYHVGTQLKIRSEPDGAYGEFGAGGVIPPYAKLEFDIEIVDVEFNK